MKRTILFFLILLLPLMAFAGGGNESNEITIAGGRSPCFEAPIALFQSRYNYTISHIDVDFGTGESITMDALLAAGTPPDIYIDFIGRSGKYLDPAYALALDIDESLYNEGALDWCRRDGVLYALPFAFPGQAMCINTSMTKGWVPNDDWTIDDFVEACKVIKSQAVDGYFASGLFAANPSGDYLHVNWFGAFGVDLFKNGDYTKSTANSPQAVKAFTFLKMLVDEGFVDPNAAAMSDDDYVAQWSSGKIALAPIRPSWERFYVPGAIEAGKLDEAFDTEYVPFPHDPSIAGAPTTGGGSLAVGHKTDDVDKAEAIQELILLLTGKAFQTEQVTSNEGFPTRTDVVGLNPSADEQVVGRIAAKFGFMDVGYANSWYYESRAVMPDVLRELYAGNITPEQAAKLYADTVDKIIADAQ